MFFKPRPQFRVGQLVRRINAENQELRHVLITNKRWIRPNGENKKQWVYDGVVLRIKGDDIIVSTYISCVIEKTIVSIDGIN